MKRRLLAVVLVIIICMTGCSSGGSGTSTKDSGSKDGTEKTTSAGGGDASAQSGDSKINIWLAGTGEAEYDQAYREVFDKFCSAHGNMSYELTFIPWSDYFTKLNTGLIGGAGPDIYMLGYGQMGSVLDLGYVQNLDEYIPENWDGLTDIAQNVLDAGKKDGSLYGLFSPSTRVWMYRKDIAQQQGVTEADLTIKTPEDFFNLVRKLTVRDDSGKVVTYGLEIDQDNEQLYYMLASMYQEQPVSLWNDDLTAAFNTDAAAQAIDQMKALVDEGCVTILAPGNSINGVQSGIAAMTHAAETQFATADSAFPGQIGFVNSEMNTLLIGNYMVLNSESKNKDIAAEMLFDLFSKESCSILAKKASLYSGRKSLDEEYLSVNPEFTNVLAAYKYSNTFSNTLNPKYNELIADFRLGLEQIYAQDDTKEQLKSMEDAWNAKAK